MTLDSDGNLNAGIESELFKNKLEGMIFLKCNLKETENKSWSSLPIGATFVIKL